MAKCENCKEKCEDCGGPIHPKNDWGQKPPRYPWEDHRYLCSANNKSTQTDF